MKKLLLSIMFLIISFPFIGLTENLYNSQNENYRKLLSQLKSSNCRERYIAVMKFAEIPSAFSEEQVKIALIQTLEREEPWLSDFKLQSTNCKELFDTEDLGLYEMILFDTVASLKDQRAVAIFERLKGYQWLARLGQIDIVLKGFEENNYGIKGLVLKAINEEILSNNEKWQDLSSDKRDKIKETLIKATKEDSDPTGSTKILAVRGLGLIANYGDSNVVTIIQKVSKEDSFYQDFSKKPDYSGPKNRYPVREEAQKVLDQLKAEGKIK